jgi:hypoxanthine phosphoribosyltransferase
MYTILLRLAKKIAKSGFVPDVIVGISRGGWVPARVLCDLLGVPVLANVGVAFYVGVDKRKVRPKLIQSISTGVLGQRVLVVDEVADTGRSLKLAKQHIVQQGAKEVRTVTIYTKPWSVVEPDYHEKKSSSWIVFPWEIKETVQSIIAESAKGEEIERLGNLEAAGLSRRLTSRFLTELLREDPRTAREP